MTGTLQKRHMRGRMRLILVFWIGILAARPAKAEQVPVRFKEGLVHGFLVLRNLSGEFLADGDLIQTARGDRVTSRLTFHFKDGSLHDETAVFSERGRFRLISDHLIQKGPAFEHPLELSISAAGAVTGHYSEDGKEKTVNDHQKVPADIANGLTLTLLKNIRPDTGETTVSFLAATPKPRMVKLHITPRGEESFSTGEMKRKALHFAVKIEIGGISGLIAPILGKEPPQTDVWILEGAAPAFVKSEGQLAAGGPIWRIELVSPVWPKTTAPEEKQEDKK